MFVYIGSFIFSSYLFIVEYLLYGHCEDSGSSRLLVLLAVMLLVVIGPLSVLFNLYSSLR